MKFLTVLLLVGTAAAQQAAFQKKFENLVSNYLGVNTGKAMDIVAADVLAEKSISDIVSGLAGKVMTLIPPTKTISGAGMLLAYQNCLKNAGSSMEKAMGVISAAFTAKLTPMYKKVLTKVKAMKKNKKPDAAIKPQAFKIATAGLTKKLVQSVINMCMSKSTKAEYDCSTPALNTIMQTKNYNMVYDAKRG